MFEEYLDKTKLNEPGRQKLDERNSFLAAGEAFKVKFWPTSGFKERIFDSSGFS